jgi:hypothetical protein
MIFLRNEQPNVGCISSKWRDPDRVYP